MSKQNATDLRLRPVSILGTGSYVPEKVLTNADLERLVDTSDEWITSRTGIKERRIAGPDEHTSDMAIGAAKQAMDMAGIGPMDIDMILVATVSPDMMFPCTACFVQKGLGARRAICMDISAACSGFLYGLDVAKQFVATGMHNNVLVIGADKLSSLVDWGDRNTCVLFGDGAGAAVVGHKEGEETLLHTVMGSDGNFGDILSMPGGGCRVPITVENLDQKLNTIKMAGKEVYKQAVIAMQNAALEVIEKAGITTEQIAWIIPHQANYRIIEAIAQRLGVGMDRVFVNLERYGNTSAAAVAIALDEANRTGALKKGDYVLLVVFGGGLTWASTLLRW
jgi:3-oxoacyl-[acyl-carrier-protein] synthase-3